MKTAKIRCIAILRLLQYVSRVLYISQQFEDNQMYMLIGCLCGLAIYNSVLIQL